MANKDRVYELGINYVLKMIKGKWKPNVLCALTIRPFRYNELLDSLNQVLENQVTQKVLTSHLKELEEDGLVARDEVKETYPKIVYYTLTVKGKKVAKMMQEFSRFGEELADESEQIDILFRMSDYE